MARKGRKGTHTDSSTGSPRMPGDSGARHRPEEGIEAADLTGTASAKEPEIDNGSARRSKIAGDRGEMGDLGDALTIQNAEQLRKKFQALLQTEHKTLELNTGSVQSVDTAGLQLLSVFIRQAAARGVSVRWCGFTEILAQGASRLDLEKVLNFSSAGRIDSTMTPL